MFYKTSENRGLASNPFKSCVIPRPIGWISSQDEKGSLNIAPYSYFNAVAEDPPTIMFASSNTHIEGSDKDSLKNIEETKEFVVNIATFDLKDEMNKTSAHLPRNVNEFTYANIETASSILVKPPRVKASPISLECIYINTIQLPKGTKNIITKIILGKVIGIYIDDNILTDGKIDITKFKPIARLGYNQYTVIDKMFTMNRPE
jgi:flavin reductase (DIM6/NTAB) family NADH-FMN oxidoreductase RutF